MFDLVASCPPGRPPAFGGCSASELLVYRVLFAQGPLSAADLARETWLNQRTVSRALSNLEARGAVERYPDPADGRRCVWVARPPGDVTPPNGADEGEPAEADPDPGTGDEPTTDGDTDEGGGDAD